MSSGPLKSIMTKLSFFHLWCFADERLIEVEKITNNMSGFLNVDHQSCDNAFVRDCDLSWNSAFWVVIRCFDRFIVTEVFEKISLGMPNLLECRFNFPKSLVLKVLMPKYCYVILMVSNDLSQNLGVNIRWNLSLHVIGIWYDTLVLRHRGWVYRC